MARVDFYVLQRADEHARHSLACRLAEKAYRLDNTVYIHARNRGDAERLDDLLWTFRDGTEGSPVVIGSDLENVKARDLLINLCDDIPAFADAFPRVAEVVTSDENCRLLSRKRYATYRDQGHTINTHKL